MFFCVLGTSALSISATIGEDALTALCFCAGAHIEERRNMPTSPWIEPTEPAVPLLQFDIEHGAVAQKTVIVMFPNLDRLVSVFPQLVAWQP